MESAAVAHVAYANAVPFIAFRSLSDLAGGESGENQIRTFFQLAADNSATVVRAFLTGAAGGQLRLAERRARLRRLDLRALTTLPAALRHRIVGRIGTDR